MDEKWSVVLGAVIALTGSALIPWLREGLASRAKARDARVVSRRAAAADLLAANAALGFADAFQSKAEFIAAVERRALAASQLLIAASKDERDQLALLLDRSTPVRTLDRAKREPPRVRMYALQGTIAAWVSGDVQAVDIVADYNSRLTDAIRDLSGT